MNLENPKQFIEIFNFISETNYYDPIILRDEEIGFSIKRKYPNNIRFKPTTKLNGDQDEVMVIWLVYNLPKVKRDQQSEKVPINIKISKYNIYKTKHFDYNYEDPDSPTKSSVIISERSPQPLEIEYTNDFFYNHSMKCLVDKKQKKYTGIEMLDYVVNQHLNTVHILKGLKIRSKLFAKSIIEGILGTIISLLVYILKHLFGRMLANSDSKLFLWHGFKREELKKIQTDVIDILGYRASKQVIVLFCIIIDSLGLFLYFSQSGLEYFRYVSNNYLLMLVHSIVLLILLDFLIPEIIFLTINILVKWRNAIAFRNLKV